MNEASTRERNNQRKWLYEEIVEKIPPFKWLPPTLDVLAQLFLVETVGVIAFIYFQMPLEAAFLGTLAIVYTVVWSAGCLYIIPWVRRLRNPTNREEFEVLYEYKKRLLLDRRYELFGGIVCFVGLIGVILLNFESLKTLLGTGLGNPLLLILLAVLAWDIGYRISLSLMTTLLATIRSIDLSRAARKRRGLEYTAYSEIRTLRSLDLVNLYWGVSAVLLLPVASIIPIMFYGLLLYLGAILFLSAVSFMAMETVPWFPPDVESILHHERFAYVTLCSKKQPHLTPVIFAYYGKYLYFVTSIASAKYRMIRKNSKIAVLVDMRDSKNKMNNRAVMLRGKASILGEITPIGIVKIYIYGLWMLLIQFIFRRKYPHYMKYYKTNVKELPLAWQNKPFISRVMVRVDVEKITYWREARPRLLRV